jgi:hypothetical protein
MRSAALLLLGCSGELAAPPPTPPVVTTPAPARALAETFAPEVVGKLVAAVPVAGDYAMSLRMSFETFVTTEMRIADHRSGAMRLTLAADGSARACLGTRGHDEVHGQYHYEPAERRQHHENSDVRLVALAGEWRVADGVAAVWFDRIAWSTCDAAGAGKLGQPITELRCIAVSSDRVPVGSLACEATATSELLGLGMPLTTAARTTHDPMAAPAGHELVLGSPGVAIAVDHDAYAQQATVAFTAGPVALDEHDYRAK